MENLVFDARRLVEEAEALKKAITETALSEDERKALPITPVKKTCFPGQGDATGLLKATGDLVQIATDVRDNGFARAEGGKYTIQDLEEAVTRVKRLCSN